MDLSPSLFTGWLPIRLYRVKSQVMVDWCKVGAARFTEPFFDQTIAAIVRRPFNLLFRHQTPIEELESIVAALPTLKPTGFIFHMSRCGSTLVTQMLGTLPQNVVIAEPRLLDFVLAARSPGALTLSEEQHLRWVQWIVAALGQRRGALECNFFVKFDSWQALELPLIRQAFPAVPWVFIYRDPLEVLVSHQQQPAPQMLPGVIHPLQLGLDPLSLHGLAAEEYCAQALSRICASAIEACPGGNCLLINYRQLPEAALASLPAHFGLHFSAADLEQMRAIAQFSAKDPASFFVPDTSAKRDAASDRLRQLARQWLDPLFSQLERLRALTAK